MTVLCTTAFSEDDGAPRKTPFQEAVDWVDSAFNKRKSAPKKSDVAGEEKKTKENKENYDSESQAQAEQPAEAKPKLKTKPVVIDDSETEQASPFNPHKNKTHFSIALGSVGLKGNSGSVLEKNYELGPSLELGVHFEQPLSAVGSFETGISLLLLGSKMKNRTGTNMNLTYLMIPLLYKHQLSNVGQYSNFYFKGGVLPMMLLSASVDTCDSVFCGEDSDLDQWLTKSRSVSDSFQKYSWLGTIGVGFNFLIFKEFIIDSLWLNTEVSYLQGLSNINRGEELGKDVKVTGVQLNLGLAFSF